MAAPMGKRNVSYSKTEEFVLCRWDSLSTIMMCADQCTRPLIEFQVLCSIYSRLQWFPHDIFPETKIQSFRKLSNYLWTETKGTIHTLKSENGGKFIGHDFQSYSCQKRESGWRLQHPTHQRKMEHWRLPTEPSYKAPDASFMLSIYHSKYGEKQWGETTAVLRSKK
jgi:hypothetical protein